MGRQAAALTPKGPPPPIVSALQQRAAAADLTRREPPSIPKIDSHVPEVADRLAPLTCALLTCALGAALCSLPGCIASLPGSRQQQQADEAVANRVYAALESDRMHLYIGLDVRVRAGVTYITGLTFDPSVRDQATEIARSVPGVTKVVNEIEVSAGSAP